MDFSFNASQFKVLFHATIDPYLGGEAVDEADEHSPVMLAAAMDQAIEVMKRADSDSRLQEAGSGTHGSGLKPEEYAEIGGYALELLEGLVAFVEQKTGQQDRELVSLAIPLSLWIARHGGRLKQIDMVVNSLAAVANETTDPAILAVLAGVIREIIDACDEEIKKDLEQTNMMRPWRILNLNYGIVATRSHDPRLIETAYDALIENLPQDARPFFREGMQQMAVIDYPPEVREVVARYDAMWGAESTLH